ncbi:succinylglutamate desuccinylase, partial [Treponema phagedenis]|nr:succinylglutamate desuccinylase [Treponema phagedenis]
RADGTLTEKAAYGIVQLIQKEGIDLTFDLHEASPEYPVINATVSHEKGMDIGAVGVMNLQLQGIDMTLEAVSCQFTRTYAPRIGRFYGKQSLF